MLDIDFHSLSIVPNRIFCIGKNYEKHIKEIGDKQPPPEPVVFMKPVCNIVAPKETISYPSVGKELHHEVEVVILIGKNGKSIPESETLTHISGITLGLDLTLRDVQKKLKMAGVPWELSKSFDQSAPLGIFKRYNFKEIDIKNLHFSCSVNGQIKQKGNTEEMIFSIPSLIHILSNWWELKPGDIIFTGTPAGVGKLNPGDKVEVESPMIGSFFWHLSSE